jgi:hypothetical protein
MHGQSERTYQLITEAIAELTERLENLERRQKCRCTND